MAVAAQQDPVSPVAQIKADFSQIKADMSQIKIDMSQIKIDMAYLIDSDLEKRLHRRLRVLTKRTLGLRRVSVVQSWFREPVEDFADHLLEALEDGRITDAQYHRIDQMDLIMQARRCADQAAVWVAVGASNRVHEGDIERTRTAADALQAVFQVDAVAAVAGYNIGPQDADRAKAASVYYLQASPPERED